MEWLTSLLTEHSVIQAVIVVSLVSAVGLALGKISMWGVSLGVTFVFFVGIVAGHFGLSIDPQMLNYAESFGLIIFVYALGVQVGPGFFSSLGKGGLKLNMLAMLVVLLGIVMTLGFHWTTGVSLPDMVGILSGAVTNTPALGAAQQTLKQLNDPAIQQSDLALGCAVAYPLGVIGIIGSILLMRVIFRVKFEKENEDLERQDEDRANGAQQFSVRVTNPALFGKDLMEITRLINRKFVFSRVCHEDDRIEIGSSETCLREGDKLLVVAALQDIDAITAFLGERVEVAWEQLDKQLVSRRIAITKGEVNGKMLGEMRLRNCFGVNVTRVNRAGVDLVAKPNLQLQIGDRLTVVGPEAAVTNVAKVLGNSLRRLREPNLVPIFLGIFLGILLGSIPFTFPGIPQPVKLGLAGGPLIISILISRFGPQYGLVTYTTMSANLMLREVGIALFLASVGLGAGDGFVETIIDGGGYAWIGYGFIITVVPLIIIGIIARTIYKVNYFTLMGLMAGSMTDPPALAYSNGIVGNDAPAVSYATVYPLTMFLRVLTAQMLILFFV